MSVVFGPVSSWLLGTALGLDLVCSDHKHCTFDCVYCPQKKQSQAATRRHWYVGLSAVECELRSVGSSDAECVTFCGNGEPTMASNLSESVDLAKQLLGLPVAVLTNSSLLSRDDVKRDLGKADTVVAKLDAYDEQSFTAINRPIAPCTFDSIVGGLSEFRGGFAGKLVLQIVLTDESKSHAREMAALARSLSPDGVQLCVRGPWRAAQTMSPETKELHGFFSDLNARSVYTNAPSWAQISDLEKMKLSRPNAAVMLMGMEG